MYKVVPGVDLSDQSHHDIKTVMVCQNNSKFCQLMKTKELIKQDDNIQMIIFHDQH